MVFGLADRDDDNAFVILLLASILLTRDESLGNSAMQGPSRRSIIVLSDTSVGEIRAAGGWLHAFRRWFCFNYPSMTD